jgi:hypothetical protein
LLAEDPFYTKQLVEKIVEAFPGQIIGAGFPKGFINIKRIIMTFFIYGPVKFLKTVLIVKYHDLFGGKVKSFLRNNSIPTKIIENINDDNFISFLKEQKIDLIISNNCPQRLNQKILDCPSKGAINLHLGKLPAYRGIFPILHAILNNEPEFGVTVHFMNVKFDDGPIIS